MDSKKDRGWFLCKNYSKKSVRFDWNVIGGRRDAKLEVEPDA